MTRSLISDENDRQRARNHENSLRMDALIPEVDLALCACLECSWLGIAAELVAQACPKCDGRVCDQGSPEFTERLKARVKA